MWFPARKRPHESYTSSDSEEEILRRLRMQQSSSLQSGQSSKYGAGPLNEHLSSLKHITVATHRERFHDPLGVAERGKVGLPPSSSECSSNSSADASVESNMGLLNGERKGKYESNVDIDICLNKNVNAFFGSFLRFNVFFSLLIIDRRLLIPDTKSFDSHSTSTTLKETHIDNRIERSNSSTSKKLPKPFYRQDSTDQTSTFSHNNNNNQDVCIRKYSTSSSMYTYRCIHLFQL